MSAPGVAIVGMACVFPGAPDLDTYWRNLRDGVDAITDAPPGRLDPVYFERDSTAPDRLYAKRGGFIDAYATFDAVGFGVMPVAAEGAEPDQLLALQTTARALDDAGYAEGTFPHDRTSVILGRGNYLGAGMMRVQQHVWTSEQLVECLRTLVPQATEQQLQAVKRDFQSRLGGYGPDTAIGLVPNLTASRIANRLDLGGSAYTVDAACASALVAVDLACRELAVGQADLAIAGAVHLAHSPGFWSVFCQLGALSRTEQIRPFDRAADGLLAGEGIGVVVLKRLEDAERDGDRIYAVIRGTGISSDGRHTSLMTPSVEGQILCLERAWRAAGVEPETVGLLEAHGTATPAGDAAELASIGAFFGPPERDGARAGLGSVKSMIGHAMPAAGAAGLIKAALAVHHAVLPPSLHCEDPQPAVAETRFRVVTETEPWEGRLRRAGVNAFGFGGINGHVVLDAHGTNGRRRARAEARPREEEILVLAAGSQEGLLEALDRGRSAGGGSWRLAVVDPTTERLEAARAAVAAGQERRGRDGIFFTRSGLLEQGGLVAFLFPGVEAVFEPRVDGVAEEFGLPPAHVEKENLETQGASAISIGILLDAALGELGIEPDVVVGHSIGEWTGMVASGMLAGSEVETFVSRLVPGSLEVPGVVFAAVGCGAEKAREVLDGLDDVAVSHDNCPHQSILCGPEEQIATACERLGRRRVLWEVLPFRSGFHSPLFADFVEPHARAFAGIPLSRPKVPLWSATTCGPYPQDEGEIRELFRRHLVEPVRFRELLLALYDHGVRVFVQMGTGSLHAFVGDTLRGLPHVAIPANAPQRTGLEQLRRVAAVLYVEGADVDLDRAGISTQRGPQPMRLQLGVPFVRLDRPLEGVGPALALPAVDGLGAGPVVEEFDAAIRELLGAQQEVVRALAEGPAAAGRQPAPSPPPEPPPEPNRLVEEHVLSVETYPELLDHCFFNQPPGWPNLADRRPVVPLTMAISLLLDLAQRFAPDRVPVAVEDFLAARWLDVEPPVTVTMTARPIDADRLRVEIEGYMQAVVRLADRYPEAPEADRAPLADERPSPIPAEEVYTDRWMFHGPRYQGIVGLEGVGDDGIRGRLEALPAKGALLDAAGQLFGYWILASMDVDRLAMPVRVKRIDLYGPEPEPGATVDCTVRVRDVTPREVRSDIQVSREGRVWAQITGWEDWRFETNEAFLAMRHPQSNLLSDEQPEGFMLVADRNWSAATRDWLARRYLSAEERAELETVPLRGRSEWLIGRIAAKDAVRRILLDRGEGVFPIEVTVRSDPSGRPVVCGMFAEDLRVSIAHKNKTAVAVAAVGHDPGIDLEPVEPRSDSFVHMAFTEAELALLPAGDRDEWLTRLWCAKEAVGKSRGTGLGGAPRALALEKIEGERLLVDGCWTETCYREGFVIAWTTS